MSQTPSADSPTNGSNSRGRGGPFSSQPFPSRGQASIPRGLGSTRGRGPSSIPRGQGSSRGRGESVIPRGQYSSRGRGESSAPRGQFSDRGSFSDPAIFATPRGHGNPFAVRGSIGSAFGYNDALLRAREPSVPSQPAVPRGRGALRGSRSGRRSPSTRSESGLVQQARQKRARIDKDMPGSLVDDTTPQSLPAAQTGALDGWPSNGSYSRRGSAFPTVSERTSTMPLLFSPQLDWSARGGFRDVVPLPACASRGDSSAKSRKSTQAHPRGRGVPSGPAESTAAASLVSEQTTMAPQPSPLEEALQPELEDERSDAMDVEENEDLSDDEFFDTVEEQ